MKGLAPLFLGIFGTFAFSWVGLTVIPNWQIGHLNPQSDEDGTDIYPMPQSGMVQWGARRIRGGRYRPKMGRSPQRASRLYFRTTCFAWEDAHGPGPCEHRGSRASGTG